MSTGQIGKMSYGEAAVERCLDHKNRDEQGRVRPWAQAPDGSDEDDDDEAPAHKARTALHRTCSPCLGPGFGPAQRRNLRHATACR